MILYLILMPLLGLAVGMAATGLRADDVRVYALGYLVFVIVAFLVVDLWDLFTTRKLRIR